MYNQDYIYKKETDITCRSYKQLLAVYPRYASNKRARDKEACIKFNEALCSPTSSPATFIGYFSR